MEEDGEDGVRREGTNLELDFEACEAAIFGFFGWDWRGELGFGQFDVLWW